MPRSKLSKKVALLGAVFVLVVADSGPTPAVAGAKSGKDEPEFAVGRSKNICKNCPIFVAVPSAPPELRRVRYVSKYELTWRNYLEAVDAGACKIPAPFRPGLDSEQIKMSDEIVRKNIEKYRIDWPIVMLSFGDIQCYKSWLQIKTSHKVVLPTEKEWEWFARAGRTGARFPWGEDAAPGHEALPGSKVNYQDEIAIPSVYEVRATPVGVRVGLFPPNQWGLYDIMGNVREMTSDKILGSDWRKLHISEKSVPDRDRLTLKGSDRYSRDWTDGISQKAYSVVWNGRSSADAGVRFILID